MKNQYFGDIRDQFKYDLILTIMQLHPGLRLKQFTFIPMLTKNDHRTDGNKRGVEERKRRYRPGSRNDELVHFLRRSDGIGPEERDFTEILGLFNDKRVRTTIYGTGYFSHRSRDAYFSNVPGHMLESALVLVDPDNGLEVNHSSEKHLLYSEVNSLLARMSKNSALMIYQHFPRQNHDRYLEWRTRELFEKTTISPVWITDDEIIFFFMVKDRVERTKMIEMVCFYADRYEKCRTGFRSWDV
jgi:hypothetical protein